MFNPYNFTLIGRSGCGKGTQAKLLIEHFGDFLYISTGDLFRNLSKVNTDTSIKIKKILKQGGLPFDDLATALWMHEIAYNLKQEQGLILDGAPRRVNEAKNLDRDGNLILAISKYKELIKICNNYQDFTYINKLKKNLDELQKRVDEQAELRKKADKKMKFEIPGKIHFSRSIKVQPLPSSKSEIKAPQPPSAEVPKTTFKAQTSQKIDQKAEDLILFSKSDSTVESKEAELDKEDITLDINLVIPEEKRPILEERKIGEELSNTLQRMIEKKGSSLSLKLCLQLITELKKSLARPLTMEDVQLAAHVFVKHDSL